MTFQYSLKNKKIKKLAHAVKHEEVLSLSETGINIPSSKTHSKTFTCRFSLYSCFRLLLCFRTLSYCWQQKSQSNWTYIKMHFFPLSECTEHTITWEMPLINTFFIAIIFFQMHGNLIAIFSFVKGWIPHDMEKLFWLFVLTEPKGELVLASYEFAEQNTKEENMKHVPSCSPQDEGVGCVCSTTSWSRLAPSPDKLPL